MQTMNEAEAHAYIENVKNLVAKIEAKVDEIWALDFSCPYFPKDEELALTNEMEKWAKIVEEIREHPESSDDVYCICDELLDLFNDYRRAVSVFYCI